MSQVFTAGDVASHNKPGDLFIVVDGDVYDVTKFQDDHPGKSPCSALRRQAIATAHDTDTAC